MARREVLVQLEDDLVEALDQIAKERGPDEGLPSKSAVSGDTLLTVPVAVLDPDPVGRLDDSKRAELDLALTYALVIAA